MCDVFIHNNKCYAYNFSNYYINHNLDKIDRSATIFMSIFFIILSMIITFAILLTY